jgi:hypothetical protein
MPPLTIDLPIPVTAASDICNNGMEVVFNNTVQLAEPLRRYFGERSCNNAPDWSREPTSNLVPLATMFEPEMINL